jgi:hypothetical protein
MGNNMKIELIGDIIDQPDGSGIAQLDVDEEGKQYLLQLGFEYIILMGIEAVMKDRRKTDGNDTGKESS